MALQFVVGGAGSGKTRCLYERAIEESMKHPELFLSFCGAGAVYYADPAGNYTSSSPSWGYEYRHTEL